MFREQRRTKIRQCVLDVCCLIPRDRVLERMVNLASPEQVYSLIEILDSRIVLCDRVPLLIPDRRSKGQVT